MAGHARLLELTHRCRKVICVGRNYAAHARELQNPLPASPFVFLKPPSAFLPIDPAVPRAQRPKIRPPPETDTLHHEVELAVWIGGTAPRLSGLRAEEVPRIIQGFSVVQDITARDLQEVAKKKGLPWTLAKGFDTSLPVSEFVPIEKCVGWEQHGFVLSCSVDGQTRQHGSTKDMLFSVQQLVAWISGRFSLEPGDCVLTGTPPGVGALKSGQLVTSTFELSGNLLSSFEVEMS